MNRGVFVTGTDTGVGKTLVACALIHALRARGVSARPMKPVAAGAGEHAGRWLNDDTVALLEAAGRDAGEAALVTPVLLREPMAPPIAAAREGRRISLDPVRTAFRSLGLPVVLVVGLRLGCLNHALLSARAIADSGLPFAGWIANMLDPNMPVADENVAALQERLAAPLLGRLPHATVPDARVLAARLDVSPLLAS